MTATLTPSLLLRAYAAGIFPMADDADDPEIFWIDPEQRGIMPLDSFHIPRRLRRTVRQAPFEIRCDTEFEAVIRACAEPTAERPRTWINGEIVRLYTALFDQGFAHSVEAWHENRLVGGLYGIALNGAFFGESMFSRMTDASKVALVHLVARLVKGGFTLLDAQFLTDHLKRFGAIEVPRAEYRRHLGQAMVTRAEFQGDLGGVDALSILQPTTQTS